MDGTCREEDLAPDACVAREADAYDGDLGSPACASLSLFRPPPSLHSFPLFSPSSTALTLVPQALTPTTKAFRSSHRATQHGCLLHDASYYQYLELRGPFSALKEVLEGVCDPSGRKVWGGRCASLSRSSSLSLDVEGGADRERVSRYASGAREVTCDIYDPSLDGGYPRGLLGPATFLWRPLPSSSASAPSSPDAPRTLLIRLHPSLCAPALLALRHTIASSPSPSLATSISLHPLERAYATFELTGPRAGEVLAKVLRPVKGQKGEQREGRKWVREELHKGPGGAGEGEIVGVEVYDPRLACAFSSLFRFRATQR